MLNTIKKEMATTFLRHYVKLYMLKKGVSGEAEAIEKITKELPILAFSNDETDKIGASFISKNKDLFTLENLYPSDEAEISGFDSLFNVPATTVEGHAALETTAFINMFHVGDDLAKLCKDNEAGLDDNVFRLYPKKISWSNISKKKFSADFLEENVEKIDWKNVCRNQVLTEDFMKKYASKINWNYISQYQKLSEEFMDYYKEMLNWSYLCMHQKLSEDFMAEHTDKLDWTDASQHQLMTEKFIEEHKGKVSWMNICKYKNLSSAFLEKHYDSIHMQHTTQFQNLDQSFIDKHYDDWNKVQRKNVFSYQALSKTFCDRYKDNIKSRSNNDDPLWSDLFDNKKLLNFDFKGTIVHKDVDINDVKSIIAHHKGPVMVKAKHSEMYFRSMYVRNHNKYRLVRTESGNKNWEKMTNALGLELFELDEVITVISRTVCPPEVKEEDKK